MADSIRKGIVPANADVPPEVPAATFEPVHPVPSKGLAADPTRVTDWDEIARQRRCAEAEADSLKPYVPTEADKIKAIFRDAPAQIEAARKNDAAERDSWLLENARQAKRDEDERIAKEIERFRGPGPAIRPRPIGRS